MIEFLVIISIIFWGIYITYKALGAYENYKYRKKVFKDETNYWGKRRKK